MKIIIGLFESNDALLATGELVQSGFTDRDISVISSVSEIPVILEDEIEGEPENKALFGAAAGGLAGGTIGAFIAWIFSFFYPSLEVLSYGGIIFMAAGGVIGAYLGSLYSTRAESQTFIDVHEEVASGKILLLVRAQTAAAGIAASILKENNGKDVEIHPLPLEQPIPENAN